jgi:hypothetical protein
MQFIEKTLDGFVTEVSQTETSVLISSLGQVCGGMASLNPEEYVHRIGVQKSEIKTVRAKLIATRDVAADSNNEAGIIVLRLSQLETTILVRTMDELANGVAILDWEFQTLVGFKRQEVRNVLHDFHRLLVNRGRDLDALRLTDGDRHEK